MKDNPTRFLSHRLFRSLFVVLPLFNSDNFASSLEESKTCEWSVKPASDKIGLPLLEGNHVFLREYLKFNIDGKNKVEGGDNSLCKATHIHIQTAPVGNPTNSYALDEWSSSSLGINEAGQTKSLFFRVGTETEMMEGTAKVEFIVCGKETVAADGQEHTINSGSMQTNKFKKVDSSVFASWFTLTNTNPGQSDLCKIDTYRLYDENEVLVTGTTAASDVVAQLSTDYNQYIEQDLLINLANDVSGKVFHIEAETLGK